MRQDLPDPGVQSQQSCGSVELLEHGVEDATRPLCLLQKEARARRPPVLLTCSCDAGDSAQRYCARRSSVKEVLMLVPGRCDGVIRTAYN